MHKLALHPDTVLRAIRARAEQGVRIAPQTLSLAETAARAAGGTTPPMLRQLGLSAGESAQAARRAQAFAAHPVPAARRGAAEAVSVLEDAAPERMFDFSRPLYKADLPMPSVEKTEMLFGAGGQLHDPDRLLSPARPSVDRLMASLRASGGGSGAVGVPALGGTAVARPRPRPVAPAATPAAEGTVVQRPRTKIGAFWGGPPITAATGTPGRLLGTLEQDPADQARSAFSGVERQVDIAPPESGKTAARKLDRRMKFRGLDISIETDKGNFRYWYDPHAEREGKTRMRYPYGYVRRTEGMDGDHIDVFIGPNEDAPMVYVVLTKKPPDFKQIDEEKCMLGFDSEQAAVDAFRAHYDDERFMAKVTALPFDVFARRAKGTYEGRSKKIAQSELVYWGGRAGGDAQAQFAPPTAIEEKPRGLAPAGESKQIIADPMLRADRVDKAFRHMDTAQNTSAIEGAWGSPDNGMNEIP